MFNTHPPLKERIATFKDLSERIGKSRTIWRYDPIIICSLTPFKYHLDRLNFLAHELNEHTDRLIISFLSYYDKVKRRFMRTEALKNIKFADIDDNLIKEPLFDFCSSIGHLCLKCGLDVYTCAEKIDLQACGIQHGSCIDVNLLWNLFGVHKKIRKDKNQRNECMCAESVDIGAYNTCLYQCSYCYANSNSRIIQKNVEKHQINSPSLIGKCGVNLKIIEVGANNKKKDPRLSLFD